MTLECLVSNPLRKQMFHQDYIDLRSLIIISVIERFFKFYIFVITLGERSGPTTGAGEGPVPGAGPASAALDQERRGHAAGTVLHSQQPG